MKSKIQKEKIDMLQIACVLALFSVCIFACSPKKKKDDLSVLLFIALGGIGASTSTPAITPSAVVTTFAGTAGSFGSTDGTGTSARFRSPFCITIDSSGNLFVTDNSNYTIRKITSAAVVTTFAGTAGSRGTTDATGTAARFDDPWGIIVDSSGNLYVADRLKYTIRKITSAGVVTTFAGTVNSNALIDGTGAAARFYNPTSIAIDSSANLYVADTGNHTIRKITSAAIVTTIAGAGAGSSGSTDATGTAARFSEPFGVAVDSSGNIFVADTNNSTIRKITSTGVVTTFAGTAGSRGSTDGTGTTARFSFPEGIAIDSSGNLYVTDTSNHTIRKITSAGVVSTIAGTAGSIGSTDGTGIATKFSFPRGIVIDSSGNLYIVDTSNSTIRKIVP